MGERKHSTRSEDAESSDERSDDDGSEGTAEVTHKMSPGSVLLFQLPTEDEYPFTITLEEGEAEVNGAALAEGKPCKLAITADTCIATWTGCSVRLESSEKMEPTEVFTENPLASYLALHAEIENRRIQAEKEGSQGPVILICGSQENYRAMTSTFFLNWAVRSGRKPLFVDLEPGAQSLSLASAVAATELRSPILPGRFVADAPVLSYIYGHNQSSRNTKLFLETAKTLSQVVRQWQEGDTEGNGIVINAQHISKADALLPKRSRLSSYDTLLEVCKAFEVTDVITLEYESLFNAFCEDLPAFVKLKFCSRMPAVISRRARDKLDWELPPLDRSMKRSFMCERYFTQGLGLPLTTYNLSLEDIDVYRLGPFTDASVEVSGYDMHDMALKSKKLIPTSHSLKVGTILAVSRAESASDLLTSPILVFVAVKEIDDHKETMELIGPEDIDFAKTKIILATDNQKLPPFLIQASDQWRNIRERVSA